ncbi:MAG: phage tail sheath family protein [Schwartzia sp.]|nr:phage tail sheath family protein [Schwartzia sp. (in: firmicutes)]
MAYFHGVRASEVPTSIIPPVNTTAGLPVVWGTAPVHLTENPEANVNKPVICYEYGEAVKAFGYSAEWDKYTLSEVMFSEFQLYGVKPIIFINVLDPKKHKTAVPEKAIPITKGVAVITDPVIKSTLVVKDGIGGTKLVENVDYIAEWDDDGVLIITDIAGGEEGGLANFAVSYDMVDASKVTANDIIGGVSLSGETKGLEWASSIYTLFSMVPGILAAPGWTHDPTVASVLKAKALTLCGLFRCIVLTDVDTVNVKTYSEVNVWKNNNNYTGINQVVCWPNVRNGDAVYHMSTHILGIIGATDAANEDVPYQSPSNMSMQATGLCLADGTEIALTLEQANMLNSQGIMTGLNFSGGWKSWGNYTGCYPSNTDPKDCFICVRRMFDWQYQTFILTYWQKVDRPLMPRLIKTIIDSENIRLNGLVARGFLLGADVQFLESENPLTDLLQGIIRVHSYITPPVPAQEIDCIFEYDVNNFSALFEAA